MSRQFLTGLNLNKNELLNARIQNLSTPPSNPVTGQIYFDLDTSQITLWDGTAWVSLAAGGDVGDQIQAAIDLLTTDDIEEGSSNLYYLTSRAKEDAADLLTSATKTNITITGDGDGLTITAENGVADSTTDDLDQGTTNLYFTDERAQDAVGNAVGTGLSYNDTSGAISVTANTYDAYGAASTVAGDLSDHISDTSTHGVTGAIVGTTDTQTLSGKSISGLLNFLDSSSSTVASVYGQTGAVVVNAVSDVQLVSLSGDIVFNADGNVYKGSVATDNEIITQGRLDQYIGDATVTGATGHTITDRITSAASTALTDAQEYADALVQGLNVKDSVRVASSTDVDIANATEIDGATLVEGDRVLLFGQSTATENGIYVFNSASELVRAADANPVADELKRGAYTLVTDGTYASTGWVVSGLTAGVTTWSQFSAANEYTVGDGLDISANEISIQVDGTSLSVSSSGIRAQVSEGGGLNIDAYGLYAQLGDGLITDPISGDIVFDTTNGYGVRKYAVNNTLLEPTSNVVTWTVTHNLGSRDVTVQLFENSTYSQVEVDVARTSTTEVTLSWVATANVSADAYRVVVVG